MTAVIKQVLILKAFNEIKILTFNDFFNLLRNRQFNPFSQFPHRKRRQSWNLLHILTTFTLDNERNESEREIEEK